MNTRLLYAVLCAALACVACRADTVYLTDGTEADGTIVEESATTVVIRRANGVLQSFRRGDVDAVVYEKKAPAAPARPAEAVRRAPEEKKAITAPAAAPKQEGAKPAAAAGTPEPGAAKTKEGEAKPGETAAAPKAGETKPGETAAAPKEGEAKPDETAAAPKAGEAKPGETAAAPKAGEAKPGETAAAPKEGEAQAKKGDKEAEAGKEGAAEATAEKEGEPRGKETAEGDEEKSAVWTPPPGLSNFPDHAKRMKKDKEAIFMSRLEQMGGPEKEKRQLAKAEVSAMGKEVLPYVAAGCYNDNADARTLCMSVVGELSGRSAVKQVIELFYAAMPPAEQADDFQVPFVKAIITTLTVITGQSFVNAEPDMPGVQDGLRQYIDWYNKNLDRLPPQLGEKKIEPDDPDYTDKIKEARTLKLAKRSWPRPVTKTDLIMGTKENNRPPPTVESMVRPLDKQFQKSVPMVPWEDIGKRGNVR